MYRLIGFLALLLQAGCATSLTPTGIVSTPTLIIIESPTVTAETVRTLTPLPAPTAVSSPTAATPSITAICSPLQDIALKDLHSITSQEFKTPSPYTDDGHPAVDLAFFTFEGLPSMLGHPVLSILPGKVVMVVDDRFPYGHMILIETPLEILQNITMPTGFLPTPIPAENIALFDPCAQNPLFEDMLPIQMDQQQKAIYTLYSHLQEKPDFEVGDVVSCGQIIGAVGITGNSVAEHLHLEIRIGPADAKFDTFAMYQPDVTAIERYNYCIWSMSGRFQAIDPALFWEDQS